MKQEERVCRVNNVSEIELPLLTRIKKSKQTKKKRNKLQ